MWNCIIQIAVIITHYNSWYPYNIMIFLQKVLLHIRRSTTRNTICNWQFVIIKKIRYRYRGKKIWINYLFDILYSTWFIIEVVTVSCHGLFYVDCVVPGYIVTCVTGMYLRTYTCGCHRQADHPGLTLKQLLP
jgi:hypothetical protein